MDDDNMSFLISVRPRSKNSPDSKRTTSACYVGSSTGYIYMSDDETAGNNHVRYQRHPLNVLAHTEDTVVVVPPDFHRRRRLL